MIRVFFFRLFLIFFFFLFGFESKAQLFNFDLRALRKEWGYWDFMKANTARFSFYIGRSQKRTMLYMNLARQNGKKFTELVIEPYIDKHPEKKHLYSALGSKTTHMLYPSFRLWLAAFPHAVCSGLVGSRGHQGVDTRMFLTLNLGSSGENCSYGYFKGLDVTLQLLKSPGHRANILDEDFSRAAVSKFFHIKHGWNSVTTFSGPKFFDYTVRGHDAIRHFQANIGYAFDFRQSIIDLSVGMRHHRDVSAARWALGAEIIPTVGNALVAPKIHFSNEYYYFALGGNVVAFFPFSTLVMIARPELSFRFPFTIKKSRHSTMYSYLDLEKSNSSIGISYGYNILLYAKAENPLGAHQLNITYSRNFGFIKKKPRSMRE